MWLLSRFGLFSTDLVGKTPSLNLSFSINFQLENLICNKSLILFCHIIYECFFLQNIIDRYAQKLYGWLIEEKLRTVQKKDLDDSVSPVLFSKVVCFPRGCVNIADVGIHP
jgi:hypothetical protein